jgi:gas vesicle protein
LTNRAGDYYLKNKRSVRLGGMIMEKTTNNYGSLFFGFLAGGTAGILAGLLFAPKPGKELISDLKDKGTTLYGDAQRMVSDAEEKAKSFLEDTKRKAEELKREADHRLSEVHQKACRALNCGAEA